MKPATKGMILSGLVYPGIGQMFLGRKYSGLGVMIVSTIALVVLIYRIVVRFYRSIDPLLDILTAKTLTVQKFMMVLSQAAYSSCVVELASLIVFIFCWVAAVVHAYYLGINMDRRQMTEFRSQGSESET